MTASHAVAMVDGIPIVELHRLDGPSRLYPGLWAVLLADHRWVVVAGDQITTGITPQITDTDIRTAQQWEVEQHFDEALEAAEWGDADRRCGLVGLVVIAAWSAITFIGVGLVWAIRAGVIA